MTWRFFSREPFVRPRIFIESRPIERLFRDWIVPADRIYFLPSSGRNSGRDDAKRTGEIGELCIPRFLQRLEEFNEVIISLPLGSFAILQES